MVRFAQTSIWHRGDVPCLLGARTFFLSPFVSIAFYTDDDDAEVSPPLTGCAKGSCISVTTLSVDANNSLNHH